MKLVLTLILSTLIVLDCHTPQAQKHEEYVAKDPLAYVLDKAKTNDIVFLGTRHKDPQILGFIANLLSEMKDCYIGLEIASDQQDKIDQYFKNRTDLQNIHLHYAINCPEYRNLLATLRELSEKNRLTAIALDLPTSLYNRNTCRDEWMAQSIKRVFDRNRGSKVLVIIGVHHALKAIEWEDSVKAKPGTIRTYLNNIKPGLEAFSICFSDPNDDFSKNFRDLNIPLAVDCNGLFSNWKLSVLDSAAAKPMKAYELVDGIIVW